MSFINGARKERKKKTFWEENNQVMLREKHFIIIIKTQDSVPFFPSKFCTDKKFIYDKNSDNDLGYLWGKKIFDYFFCFLNEKLHIES